jgi:hypothetical protein
MLESVAIRLLETFAEDSNREVHPLDFTALLYLRDCGYVDVSVAEGAVVARKTVEGKRFVSERSSAHRFGGR